MESICGTLLLFTLLFAIQKAPIINANDYKLRFVYLNIRHGNKHPMDYATNIDQKYGVKLPAEYSDSIRSKLTSKGWEVMRNLGARLRARYAKLLNVGKGPGDQIYMSHTNEDRTLHSAQAMMRGISKDWPNVIDEIEYSVNLMKYDLNHDDKSRVTYKTDQCPRYFPEREYLRDEKKQVHEYVKKMKDYVDNIFKKKNERGIKLDFDLIVLTGVIQSLYHDGKPIPSWADNDVYLRTLVPRYYHGLWYTHFHTPALKQMLIGPMVSRIMKIIEELTLKKRKTPINIDVSHETTVFGLICAMKFHNKDIFAVGFGATLALEIYTHSKKPGYFVKVAYSQEANGYPQNIVNYQIGNCNKLCPLEEFLDIVYDATPLDWTALCHSQVLSAVPPKPPRSHLKFAKTSTGKSSSSDTGCSSRSGSPPSTRSSPPSRLLQDSTSRHPAKYPGSSSSKIEGSKSSVPPGGGGSSSSLTKVSFPPSSKMN